jgi:hypothetical protein
LPAVIGEFSFCGWLLLKGAKIPKMKSWKWFIAAFDKKLEKKKWTHLKNKRCFRTIFKNYYQSKKEG